MTTLREERPRLDSPLGDLARFGDAPALVTSAGSLTHAELADRVAARAGLLGATRRLVLLECRNDVETVVTYLAALAGHHPVLLTGPDCHRGDLVETYRPDVLAAGDRLEAAGDGGHDLHPDLALLLSTSGSTGSPKLVRLSRDNLRSNAASIADFLRLTPADRAATTLPLHYCYGLSVLHSHLLVGASVLLTQRSVVEEEFWQEVGAAGVTSLAGVPHVFDLLDSAGFAERDLPTLRTLTQAGGRLPPATARRYAELGRRRGFELVMMYGQTEATARMAYLPPHLAAQRPGCIGIPIPGGSLRIDGAEPGEEVGELVYAGDNVMLGYAEHPRDLALGRTVEELRTGDLARQHEDGLFELVGRRSRFAKLFGLRVDLDRVEELARAEGVAAVALEHDDRLHLCVTDHAGAARARRVTLGLGLPPHAVRAHVVERLPRTASGKPDRVSLQRHVATAAHRDDPTTAPGEVGAATVRDLYAQLLGRPDATEEDSFVSLGGDSLSYVEVSVRLGRLLGTLPRDWAQLTLRELAATTSPRRHSRWTSVETPLVLRAAAIALVVATHANLVTVMGGAHVLLALVGYNLARFQLAAAERGERRRSLLRAARSVAVPSALWIAGAGAVTGMYDASTALLLNNLLGSDTWDLRWQFWFLEVVVWSLVGTAVLVSVPTLHRLERAGPYAAALGVLTATAGLRWWLVGVEAGPTERYALPVVLWCVALGWLAARSRGNATRVATSVAAAVTCYGFFGDPVREALVAGCVALLVWLPRLRVPAVLLPALGALAASSLFVYLTHWQVYPHLEVDHPLLATLASFAVGLLCWRAYHRLAGLAGRLSSAGRARVRHVLGRR